MRSEGYGTWSVRLCVCLTDLNSGTTGNKAARVRYTRLQRNNRSKNNVADLAKTAEFWQEKPASPWTKFRDPTHQLSRRACVFITCTTGSQPPEQHCPESCVAVNATSSAASLFQNRCIRVTRVCRYKPHGHCCRSCVSQLHARAAPVAYTNRVCAEGLHFSAFSL